MRDAGWSTRWFWGGSRLRPGLVYGACMAVGFGVVVPYQGPLVSQIVSALVAGAVAGALMAWYLGRLWPTGNELDAAERAEVARAVTRGESPQDRRLAHATLQLADLVRDKDDRQRHDRWLVPVCVIGLAGFASYVTATGPVLQAVMLWATTILLGATYVHRGGRVARIRSQATLAAAAARAQLGATPPRAAPQA